MNQEQVWDTIAEQWHQFRQIKFKPVYDFIERYKLKKGKILEVGCGNARNLIPFASAGFECYGVDFSFNMLQKAKEYAKKNHVRIRLIKAEMTHLPYDDGTFDYILHISSLHTLDSEEKRIMALKEAYKVIKKGGLMLLTVWNRIQLRFIFKSRDVNVAWGKDKVTNRYYHLFDYFELKRLIHKTDFKIRASRPFGKNLIFVLKK